MAGWLVFGQGRSLVAERHEHLRSRLPDIRKTLGQELRVAFPKLDVVARCGAGFKPDALAHDEGGRFGLRLWGLPRRSTAAIPAMQKFMRLCCAQHKRIYVAMEFMWRKSETGKVFAPVVNPSAT